MDLTDHHAAMIEEEMPEEAGGLVAQFVKSGKWLDAQEYPALEWAVEGIIPEGMGLLVGGPKIGKSWLTGGMCLALAAGTPALGGIPTGDPRPVLWLALEDGDKRVQSRCRLLLDGLPIPANLHVVTEVPPHLALDVVREWLGVHGADRPLVVIDTLARVIGSQALPRESDYLRDYRVGSKLKALADAHPGATVLVVHHSRKAEAVDFVDAVSGTQGLAGAADFVCLLRRARNESAAVLSVTGRDAPEGEYALNLTGVGRWELNGGDLVEAAKNAAEVRATSGLGDRSSAVVAVVADHPEGVTPKEVGEALDMTAKEAGDSLGRLLDQGRVDRPKRGVYTPLPNVQKAPNTGGFDEFDTFDTYAEEEE